MVTHQLPISHKYIYFLYGRVSGYPTTRGDINKRRTKPRDGSFVGSIPPLGVGKELYHTGNQGNLNNPHEDTGFPGQSITSFIANHWYWNDHMRITNMRITNEHLHYLHYSYNTPINLTKQPGAVTLYTTSMYQPCTSTVSHTPTAVAINLTHN